MNCYNNTYIKYERKEENMKNIKKSAVSLLLVMTIVALGACGNKKSDSSLKSSPYDGLTLQEILDKGFEYDGYGASEEDGTCWIGVILSRRSGNSHSYSSDGVNITTNDFPMENLTFNIKVSEQTYKEFKKLSSSVSKEEFIMENFSDKKAAEYNYSLSVMTKQDLLEYVNKDLLVRYEKPEGKTIGTLLEEGYLYEDCNENGILEIYDNEYRSYWMILDFSEKKPEGDLFMDGEEILQDYIVTECYVVK